MKFWPRGLILFLTAAAVNLGFFTIESRAQTTQVNLGVTFRNARLASLWIAEEEGYFKKQMIDLKTMNISGGSRMPQPRR
jgi:ABC-type nitrate/sulfonate/bicarbonate transport system substrate-binding protein